MWTTTERSRDVANHAPTAGETALAAILTMTDATNDTDDRNSEHYRAKMREKPQEIAGVLATLLRPQRRATQMTEKVTSKTTRRNVGEIIQRGRIYYIRYYDGRGRRRLETTKSTDRNEAEKQLRKRLTAKDAGVSPDAAIGKLTIKDATDDVITDYKTNGRKSLRDVTAKTALHFLPFFGEKRRMNSITTADLRAFIAARQEAGAKAAEINRELAILRRAFNLALQAGRLLTKPYFPMLKERNTRTGFLEQDQIDRICVALEATETADDGRKTAGELPTSCGSPSRPAGGRQAKSCHSNGVTSIGRRARCD
jgi:hypothetical protein